MGEQTIVFEFYMAEGAVGIEDVVDRIKFKR